MQNVTKAKSFQCKMYPRQNVTKKNIKRQNVTKAKGFQCKMYPRQNVTKKNIKRQNVTTQFYVQTHINSN